MTIRIDNICGRPVIKINDEILSPMMVTIISDFSNIHNFNRDYYINLYNSGIKIFFLMCDNAWFYKEAEENLKIVLEQVYEAIPEAYFIIRIGLHPPIDWCEKNPDECFTYNNQKPPIWFPLETHSVEYPMLYSLASEKWREDAKVELEKTINYISQSKYAERIIGYFLAAGGTSEWYYQHNLESNNQYGDFSEAFKKSFSKFLSVKYKDDNEIKAFWKDENASINNPKIYGLEERFFVKKFDDQFWYDDERPPIQEEISCLDKNIGSFLNIDNFKGVFDFYQAWHKAVADSQLYFAKFIKNKFSNNILVGSFYGSLGCTDYFSSGTASSTLEILNSGYVDFLASPGVYVNRQPGGFSGQRELVDSFRLRNMIHISEEDTRTYLDGNYYQCLFDCYDIHDSINILKRDFGRTLSNETYAWWFDQIYGGGRYKHQEIYKLFSIQQEIIKKAFKSGSKKNSEIAYIYDEESLHTISNLSTKDIVERFRNYEAEYVGAPADYYFHNDLKNSNMPDYKMYVFFNTFYLTSEERKVIKNKLKKNNATAIWIYASGIINPDKNNQFDVENIEDLIEIKIEQKNTIIFPKFRFKENNVFNLNQDAIYGLSNKPVNSNILIGLQDRYSLLSPVFYSADQKSKNVAFYLQNKLPAISIKECNGFTSIFYGAKQITSDIVRQFAKFAGCHIYSETDDCIYISDEFITIHAKSTGQKNIRLKGLFNVKEIYTDKFFGKKTDFIEFNMKLGETYTFNLERC